MNDQVDSFFKKTTNRCDSTDAALSEKTLQIKELWTHSEMMTRSMNLELDILKKRAEFLENKPESSEPLEIVIFDGGKTQKAKAPPEALRLLKDNAKKIKGLSR